MNGGLTRRAIEGKKFHDAFRGYSHEEVDGFLDEVADAVGHLAGEIRSLTLRVCELEERARRGVDVTDAVVSGDGDPQ
ncbi:MAG: DivIVA domain-containing protein [Actinomycetota bacterium]